MHNDAPTQPKLFLVGVFAREDAIISVTRAATDAGLPVHDTFTPYAVHGLDAAQKLPRSKLTFVCGAGGALGFCTSFFLQSYTQGIETPVLSGWPINVGGKPFLPWPAFVPVLFELTVLFAGLISAAGLLAFCGLFPGKKPRLLIDGVTDDRFAIALDPAGKGFDEAQARALFASHGAVDVSYLGDNA
jgi:hypothetical protein